MELIGLFCLLVNKVNRLHDDCHLFHEIFCTGNGQDFTIIKWRDGYFFGMRQGRIRHSSWKPWFFSQFGRGLFSVMKWITIQWGLIIEQTSWTKGETKVVGPMIDVDFVCENGKKGRWLVTGSYRRNRSRIEKMIQDNPRVEEYLLFYLGKKLLLT